MWIVSPTPARLTWQFDKHKLSVDVIASSEVSVSLTLNKGVDILSKVQDGPMNRAWAETAENKALAGLVEDLSEVADLSLANGRRARRDRGVCSMLGDVEETREVALAAGCGGRRLPLLFAGAALTQPAAAHGRSIVTLIANVKKSSSVMALVFRVLDALDVLVTPGNVCS